MKKEEVLELFLKKGVSLTPRALEILSSDENVLRETVEKIEKEKPLVVDVNFIPRKSSLKILKKTEKKEKTLTTPDVLRKLVERYKFLHKILSRKTELVNLVSIRKIGALRRFSVIGMVRDVEGNEVTLEDLTGDVRINLKTNTRLIEDEVVGVVCQRKGDEIIGTRIVWPDVPLLREKKKPKLTIFIGKPKKKTEGYFFSFNNSKIFFNEKEISEDLVFVDLLGSKILFITKELMEEIKKQEGETETRSVLINILKRRHVFPKFSLKMIKNEDVFRIDEIPDFIITETNTTNVWSYKGVVLVCYRDGSCLRIDLEKGEVISLDR